MDKPLDVLLACEESSVVREEFIKLGHNAWSCDLLPSRIPGNHYQQDILELLKENKHWDLMIAFPPCTRLANSGVSWLERRNLWADMREAAEFFKTLLSADIEHIAIENPIPHSYAVEIIGRKYDQIVQPWWFGEDASKATCLWLKGLPLLKPTQYIIKERYANQTPSGQNKLGPSPDRARIRATTYLGMATAMATQWSEYLKEQEKNEQTVL